MLPQHQKGDALKEYVRILNLVYIVFVFTICLLVLVERDLTELARDGKLDPTIGRDDGECLLVFMMSFFTIC